MDLQRALRGMVMHAALLSALVPALAWADADSARNKAAAWLIKQQRGDGSWANADGVLGVQATAASLLALKNAGLAKAPSFGAASAWLANADADSVDAIARKVEGLANAGHQAAAQREADRLYGLRALTSSATWGGYGTNGVDHVDTALGLAALRAGDANYMAKVSASGSTIIGAYCDLVNARIAVASGKKAWPATPAATSQSAAQGRPSVIATALLAAELRGMEQRTNLQISCNGTGYSFATVESEAIAWLLDQQNTDSGFGEQRADGSKGPSNALVTAWVYRALISQAAPTQPQAGNALNWLLAQQDSSTGSWRGDPLVTAAVAATLPAATGAQLTDADRDGVPDVVEAQLGSNAAIVDARGQMAAPTLAAVGMTATSFAASARVGQAFSYALGTGSGFSLAAGALPPGLSLNSATGQISGTPTQAGSYSFDYQATVAGATQLVIGRIDVATAVQPGADAEVPIPLWALVSLGAALAGASQGVNWRGRQRQPRRASPSPTDSHC